MPDKDVQDQAGSAAAFHDGVAHTSREQDFSARKKAGPTVDWEQTLLSTSGEREIWIWDNQISETLFREMFKAVFSSKSLKSKYWDPFGMSCSQAS